jgi:hypothetical protein
MVLCDGVVQIAGDIGDGLRGVGFAQRGLENLADLTSGDAAQEGLADQFVDGSLAALVAGQEGGAEAAAGTRDPQAAEHSQFGGEIAEIAAIAIVPAGGGGVLVVAQLQIAVLFGPPGLVRSAV